MTDDLEHLFGKCEKSPSLFFRRLALGKQSTLSGVPRIDVELIQPIQHVEVNVSFHRQMLLDAPVERNQVVDVGTAPSYFSNTALNPFSIHCWT